MHILYRMSVMKTTDSFGTPKKEKKRKRKQQTEIKYIFNGEAKRDSRENLPKTWRNVKDGVLRYVHYIDIDDGFMDICKSQNLWEYALNRYNLLDPNYILIKLF